MIYQGLFGSFGWQELVLILLIVLIIFGPKNLPKLGRMLGLSLREFRHATDRSEEEPAQPRIESDRRGHPPERAASREKGPIERDEN